MFKNIDYKVFKHSNYNLVFTLIVETLDKKKIISKDIEIELTKVIYNIFENHNKCVISKIVFEEESILIINFQSTPNIFLSSLISNFKTVSSRRIERSFIWMNIFGNKNIIYIAIALFKILILSN